MTSSIITCLAWAPQGVAKENPEKLQVHPEEIEGLLQRTSQAEGDAAGKKAAAAAAASAVAKETSVAMDADDNDDDLAEYDLENYDSPDSDGEATSGQDRLSGLAMFASNQEDPYVTLQEDEDDRDDMQDLRIQPKDNLIVAGRAEEDSSCLEVYVYNEEEGTLYVHHDILLPSFPLAAEWMNFDPGNPTPGNMVAIGYMTPNIDVWNLDVVDCLEPAFTLGKKTKKSKKKAAKASGGHTDAVLDLAWNRQVRHGLASASADSTIALWDMERRKVMTTLAHHDDKVQTLAWHPFEAQSLASGSFDMSMKVYDCRSPQDSFKSWAMDGEIERILWNHFQPFQILASTDKGNVFCMDVRTDKSVFTLKAHDDAVTALSLSTEVPSCLVTASADHTYKIWDIKDNKPSLIASKDPKMGTVNCVHFGPNSPFVFALGGERDGMRLVNVTSHASAQRQFGKRRRYQAQSASASTADESSATGTGRPDDDDEEDNDDTAEDAAVAMETEKAESGGESLPKKKKTKKKKKRQSTTT